MVESRGRTSSRDGASGVDSRGVRIPPAPSLQRAVTKALVPVAILIPFILLTQKNTAVTAKAFFIVLAFLMYIPMSYYADRWAYQRYLKQKAN